MHLAVLRSAFFTIVFTFFAVKAAISAFIVERVATGLEQPVYVTAPPGDTSRLFIVEANSGGSPTGAEIAHIKILHLTGPQAGTVDPTPFLTISGIPQAEDQGLFCLAFHPNYASNGYFYVTYAFGFGGGESRIERYQVSAGNPNVADPNSATVVLSFFKPFFNHNGNWLGFSPTDVANGKYYLYHATGDGGANQDPMNLAQNLAVKNGKVLRVDVGADGLADDFPLDPLRNYAVPADNPFLATAGADSTLWAVGLRNPWRASFDRLTGDFYIGNVGALIAEEVEFQPFDSSGGENYGWSRLEGTSVGSNPGPPQPNDVAPMYESVHGGPLTSSPQRSLTGGYVYRGPVAELQGHYICADFLGTYDFGLRTGSTQIYSLRYDGSSAATFDGTNIIDGEVLNRTAEFAPDAGAFDFISSFGEDAEGNLYIVDMGNLGTPDGLGLGEVFKITCTDCPPTAVDGIPISMRLGNHPNPFNPRTVITYVVPANGARIHLEIVDLRGARVRLLANDFRPGGGYRTSWDGLADNGRPVASGIYLCRLRTGLEKAVRKLTLVR